MSYSRAGTLCNTQGMTIQKRAWRGNEVFMMVRRDSLTDWGYGRSILHGYDRNPHVQHTCPPQQDSGMGMLGCCAFGLAHCSPFGSVLSYIETTSPPETMRTFSRHPRMDPEPGIWARIRHPGVPVRHLAQLAASEHRPSPCSGMYIVPSWYNETSESASKSCCSVPSSRSSSTRWCSSSFVEL